MLDLLLLVPLSFPASAPTAAPTPAAVQDEERPDKREDIKEMLAEFSGHVGKRGKEDLEAIAIVDSLHQEFGNCGEKDRKDIVKALSKSLKAKRTEKDGVFDNKLYVAVAVAMGDMGPESTKELIGWIDHKQHRKDIGLQRHLILSLGKTHAESAVKPLVDLLTHKDAAVQGAAAEALGGFNDIVEKERKKVFESILKVVTALKGDVDANVNDIIARERYDVIKAPMVTALQLLSGHDERDPVQWQHWWNKNKKRDWDEES